jgi:RNA polymerase sigma-70 factor, ECF subfamily
MPSTQKVDWRRHRKTEMDEKAALEAAVKGSLDAYNVLVAAYQDMLYHHAYHITGDHAAAEDAVQETFIRAYQKLDTYRGGSFPGWLLRINTNLCLDMLRKIKREGTIPLEPTNSMDEEFDSPYWIADPGPSPEELCEQNELAVQVRRGLMRLAPHLRQVVALVDLSGLDYTQAAQILGVPLGTIKSRLARAREALRRELFPGSSPAAPATGMAKGQLHGRPLQTTDLHPLCSNRV